MISPRSWPRALKAGFLKEVELAFAQIGIGTKVGKEECRQEAV